MRLSRLSSLACAAILAAVVACCDEPGVEVPGSSRKRLRRRRPSSSERSVGGAGPNEPGKGPEPLVDGIGGTELDVRLGGVASRGGQTCQEAADSTEARRRGTEEADLAAVGEPGVIAGCRLVSVVNVAADLGPHTGLEQVGLVGDEQTVADARDGSERPVEVTDLAEAERVEVALAGDRQASLLLDCMSGASAAVNDRPTRGA